MDQKQTPPKVAAVVPAYNEGERIGNVLQVLAGYPGFDEVIVVDDGSTDNTTAVARQFTDIVITHEHNSGKGQAMDEAVRRSTADIIFFSDADVVGLTHTMIDRTLEPVISNKVDMMIAMRNRKIYYLRFILNIIPLLGGERAVRRDLWERVPAFYKSRFKIEAALNFYAKYHGHGFSYAVFSGLSQTIKEKKYGVWDGLKGRIRMFAEVASAQIQLQLRDVPPTIRSGRLALMTFLGSFGGLVLGGVLLFASYTGPTRFVQLLFVEQLASDSATPAIHALITTTRRTSAGAFIAAGVFLVVINTLVASLSAKNTLHLLRIIFPKEKVK
ncbi:MAG: glycosyltransferase family 2 protein [Candidatus Andersenbacteria bacterium]